MSDDQLDVVISPDGAMAVRGEIDVATSDDLRARLDAAMDGADGILLIDLSGVEFIDSSGIRVLLQAHERCVASQVEFVVRDPSRSVLRVLEITGLTQTLRIE